MTLAESASRNLSALSANPYPGRGIVVGQTPDATRYVQVYWIMGRSANSRNRIFVQEGDTVRTAPFDASLVQDPSLIIYNCVRVTRRQHIVTNGDQTDTIADALDAGRGFGVALQSRTFEPDAPNYTPRISAVVDPANSDCVYELAILKTQDNNPDYPVRLFFAYASPVPGLGHMICTYAGDGAPLPSFRGEPVPVPLFDSIATTRDTYWNALNADNRVSLLVKFIDPADGASEVSIVNKQVR